MFALNVSWIGVMILCFGNAMLHSGSADKLSGQNVGMVKKSWKV